MTATAPEPLRVIGGVDTHADTIHVAVIDELGRALGDRELPTTPAGYRAALAFLISFGRLLVVGIEGTSSYGIGLTRAAQTPLLSSALTGALVVVVADLLGRRLFSPIELPVGVLTAAVGAPYLMWLIARTRSRSGGAPS